MRSGTSEFYYHYDSVGSTRNVSSSTGGIQWTDTYEPFGPIRTETKNVTSAPDNPMKFTGEYLDATALYHLRARQYDATLGRFTGTDPAPTKQQHPSVSTYAYADNRPTVFMDPSGMTFEAIDTGVQMAWLAASTARADLPCIKCIPGKVLDAVEAAGRAVVDVVVRGGRATLRVVVAGREIVVEVAKAAAEATAKSIRIVIREAQQTYRIVGAKLAICIEAAIQAERRLPPSSNAYARAAVALAACLRAVKKAP